MGNTIWLSPDSAIDSLALHMSNGLTSVLLDTLVLSGSALAKTDRECALIIWLASHDQAILGIGTVSFSLTEMPWIPEQFLVEQQFLLQVIAEAQTGLGWEQLDYTPNQHLLMLQLERLAQMIRQLTVDKLNPSLEHEAYALEGVMPEAITYCPRHRTLLHWQGCIICNASA